MLISTVFGFALAERPYGATRIAVAVGNSDKISLLSMHYRA